MAKFCGKDLLIQRGYVPGGAWVLSTAYLVGAVVTNGGNVYECVTAGTSAGSGGPSGTGTGIITDGTVGWRYVSATATDGNGYRTIAGMRSTSLSLNNEQVDVTDKDDGSWRELLSGCGVQSMELSASGSFTDSRAHNVMMTDVVANAVRLYRVISGAGDVFTGNFQPTSLERTGEYNQAEQFSLSLGSAGTIAYVAA